MTDIQIREEIPGDITAIRTLTEAAFRGRPYADGDEQDVIDRLREADALVLSLVALDDDEVVGQVTFSPAINEDNTGPWFALGPVSVSPERQGEGIGASLIEAGLTRLASTGALGCILTGDPNYYSRFGFEVSPATCAEKEPAEFFQLKLLQGNTPRGRFTFHGAFYDES